MGDSPTTEASPDPEPDGYIIPDACFVCGEPPTHWLPETLQRTDAEDDALGGISGFVGGVGYRRYESLAVELPFCDAHWPRVQRVLAWELMRYLAAVILILPVLGGGIYLAIEMGVGVIFPTVLVCAVILIAVQLTGRRARRDAGLEVRLAEHLGRLVLERHDPRIGAVARIPLRDLRVRRAAR